jgi:hypothetical protein
VSYKIVGEQIVRKETLQILAAVKLGVFCLWPFSAYAATIAFGDRLTHIPPLALAMTFILSSLAGVTSLLQAMKDEYEKKGKIDRLWLFVSSKMFGSNVAGLVAFLVSENFTIGEGTEAAAIIIAAFGGTWALNKVLTFYTQKILPDSSGK